MVGLFGMLWVEHIPSGFSSSVHCSFRYTFASIFILRDCICSVWFVKVRDGCRSETVIWKRWEFLSLGQ